MPLRGVTLGELSYHARYLKLTLTLACVGWRVTKRNSIRETALCRWFRRQSVSRLAAGVAVARAGRVRSRANPGPSVNSSKVEVTFGADQLPSLVSRT